MLFENNGVYINYSDDLFNFHKLEAAEKLIKIDLDNQEIYQDKEDNIEENNLSEEIMNKHDYITLNYFPISITHTNLTINIDQKFPQVLSDEFIQQVLQIFTLVNNQTLRCGYDSLGGGCIINHLHFEIIFLDDLGLKKMPIEDSNAIEIFQTKFINLNPEEINMFDENVQVVLSKVNFPINAWKITANEVDETHLFQASIANLVNGILSDLIESEIPHNMIMSDNGHTFFIVPKKFIQSQLSINTCWNDMGGLVTVKEENLTEDEVLGLLNSVALNNEEFEMLTERIVNKFESKYELIK